MDLFRKRGVWLLILVIVLLAAVLSREGMMLRLAPKLVLTGPVTQAWEQLENRFSDNPLLLAAPCLDPKGQYTAQLGLDTGNDLLGDIHYDMTLRADGVTRRVLAQGTASAAGKTLDLSFYADTRTLALSSEDLVRGLWFGLDYDSFSQDLERFPLLNLLLPKKTVEGWNESLQSLQGRLEKGWQLPDLTAWSSQDLRKAVMGLLLLPGQVSEQSLTRDGEEVSCYRVRYEATGELLSLAGLDPAGQAELCFYLRDRVILGIQGSLRTGSEVFSLEVWLGQDAENDPLDMTLEQTANGRYSRFQARIETLQQNGLYEETWTLSGGSSLRYVWDPDTGELTFFTDGKEARALLQAEDGTLTLETGDLGAWLAFSGETPRREMPCTLRLSRGGEVPNQICKKMDQWSLEDLGLLLTGIGGLLGIPAGK